MRFIQIFIFCMILIIISGCGTGGGNRPVDDDYRTGVQSLSMSFMQNAPPDEIVQNQQASIVIKLDNKGASNITRLFITLGYDRSALEVSRATSAPLYIVGRSATDPNGGSDLVSFPFTALELPQESQRRTVEVVATACYTYQTQHKESVCIDADPYNVGSSDRKKICTVRDLSPRPAGGPVNVNKITVSYNQENHFIVPQFTFYLQASGNGLVFEPAQEASYCSSAVNAAQFSNRVFFYGELSDAPLRCGRNEENRFDRVSVVKLIDGKGVVSCSGDPIDVSATGSYYAPLYVQLDYGYSFAESKRIDIIR